MPFLLCWPPLRAALWPDPPRALPDAPLPTRRGPESPPRAPAGGDAPGEARAPDAPAGTERAADGAAPCVRAEGAIGGDVRAAAARTGVARAVAAPTADKPAVPFPTVGSRPPGEAADSVRGALTRRLPGEGEARTIGGGGSGGGATPIVGAPADARPPGAVACGGRTKAPVPAGLGSGRGVPGKVGAGRVLSRVLNGSGPSLAMTGRGRAVLGPPSCVRSTLATTRAECVGAPAAGAAAGGRRLAAGAASSESGLSRAGLYGAPKWQVSVGTEKGREPISCGGGAGTPCTASGGKGTPCGSGRPLTGGSR